MLNCKIVEGRVDDASSFLIFPLMIKDIIDFGS
jgi:hypothetical protein